MKCGFKTRVVGAFYFFNHHQFWVAEKFRIKELVLRYLKHQNQTTTGSRCVEKITGFGYFKNLKELLGFMTALGKNSSWSSFRAII
jgi:hypothetical protein